MQEGSGTQGLTEFFERMTPDGVFIKKIQQIRHDDNIIIRTKESLFYYELFKKYHTIKTSSEDSCPDCRHTMEVNSKFCRMCGRFPIQFFLAHFFGFFLKILRHPLQQKKYFFPSCSYETAKDSSISIPQTGSTGMSNRRVVFYLQIEQRNF